MGKICELCGERATLHCSADDAELCWSCDANVHGANYLVARHMRLVLCKHCSAETECQTSGPSPCPLCRSCAACDPAHVEVDEDGNLKGSGCVLNECNDDSEELPASAVPWLKMGGSTVSSCANSQESLNDAHSSVEDEKAARKSSAEREMRGRLKRVRGGASRAAIPTNKRSLAPGGQIGRKQAPVRKSRRKRSRSPVSVIPVDNNMFCRGSYSDAIAAL